MKRLLYLFLLFISSLGAYAQSDSIVLGTAPWKMTTLAKGVIWKVHHFNQNQLFKTSQFITVVEISTKAKWSKLVLAYSDSLQTTSMLSASRKALVGINGSFFRMRGPDPDHRTDLKAALKLEPSKLSYNRSVVYLRVQDSLIAENKFATDSLRKRHQQGVIAIKNGRLSILNTLATNLYWEKTLKANDIMATGPVMLMNGQYQPIPDDAFCNDRHPRTAVGKKNDGTIVLFVVDGRFDNAAGMSIPELQQTMRWLGCVDAINLDGGGSSTMYIQGQPHSGVVNHPSDNKRFNHEGEREVANALLLVPVK